jgi:hypothetical protein
MKLKLHTLIILSLMLASFTTGCAQRLPKAETAQGSLKSYFKGYGGEFKASDFGQHKVDDVEVNNVQELQRGLAWVEAFVSLDNGTVVYKVGATLEKKTFRWKVISWENLGRAS